MCLWAAQRMPPWWEWYSNVNPVAWSVYGLVASQLGDDYTYYVNTCAPPLASSLWQDSADCPPAPSPHAAHPTPESMKHA